MKKDEDSEDEFDDFDDDDEELEDIIENDLQANIPVIPRLSELIIPSLERTSIIDRSLESGVMDAPTSENDSNLQYGAQDDYIGGGDYLTSGDGSYDSTSSNRVNIEGTSGVSLSMGSLPIGQSDNIMQGMGNKMRDGKSYQSSLEQGSNLDEERRKRERRMM